MRFCDDELNVIQRTNTNKQYQYINSKTVNFVVLKDISFFKVCPFKKEFTVRSLESVKFSSFFFKVFFFYFLFPQIYKLIPFPSKYAKLIVDVRIE